ncbi:MAG: phosphotransferase [Deltaproteobacteria bacterium]|nr:phosphotransferase [Deltaproteobacteria bacterium]
MSEAVPEKMAALLAKRGAIVSLDKLFGEASYRVYYRATLAGGETFIVMQMPAGRQSASEEITNYEGPKLEPPFLNVARWLERTGLPAPRVIDTDLDAGLILLQDLGDKTLEKLLPSCNESMRDFFYKQAIDLLLQFQKAGLEKADPECMAFQRSFDLPLLLWEFEHFLEYGIEDRFGKKIPQKERKWLMETGHRLVEGIVRIPYGLTHRDFQSRNLMLFQYQFYLIDFQDALMGPPQYDLVALLRDSYVVLPDATVEALLDYYLEGRDKLGLPKLDRETFKKHFHLIALQRKLKDAGRFQYIKKVKGNPNFLPHVPASLGYVKSAFASVPEFQGLQEVLAKHVPELT